MPSSRNAALLDRTRNPQQRVNVSSTRHERLDTFTPHLKGLLLMLGASLCWSTGGLFVRSVSIPNSWEIAFWRSLSMGVFLLVWLSFRYAGNVRRAVVAIGPGGFLAGLCMAASFLGFILAVTQTTVAHTLVIISTTPFLAALFGRVFLGELVPVRRYVAMSIALTGIVAMCLDSFTAGTLTGSIIAGGCAVAFAACVILLRHSQARADMTPAILVAALLSSAVALSFSLPFQAAWQDIGILACMGTLQGGLGCLLMTLAARYITAVEVSLLALLETILGPLWVWIGVGERPSDLAIIGGVVVVASLALNEFLGLYRQSRAVEAPPSSGQSAGQPV